MNELIELNKIEIEYGIGKYFILGIINVIILFIFLNTYQEMKPKKMKSDSLKALKSKIRELIEIGFTIVIMAGICYAIIMVIVGFIIGTVKDNKIINQEESQLVKIYESGELKIPYKEVEILKTIKIEKDKYYIHYLEDNVEEDNKDNNDKKLIGYVIEEKVDFNELGINLEEDKDLLNELKFEKVDYEKLSEELKDTVFENDPNRIEEILTEKDSKLEEFLISEK